MLYTRTIAQTILGIFLLIAAPSVFAAEERCVKEQKCVLCSNLNAPKQESYVLLPGSCSAHFSCFLAKDGRYREHFSKCSACMSRWGEEAKKADYPLDPLFLRVAEQEDEDDVERLVKLRSKIKTLEEKYPPQESCCSCACEHNQILCEGFSCEWKHRSEVCGLDCCCCVVAYCATEKKSCFLTPCASGCLSAAGNYLFCCVPCCSGYTKHVGSSDSQCFVCGIPLKAIRWICLYDEQYVSFPPRRQQMQEEVAAPNDGEGEALPPAAAGVAAAVREVEVDGVLDKEEQ